MANVIILAVLAVIAVYAVSASRKHFRGEGGCCGGAGTVREKKKLTAPRIGEKTVRIEGMHCENCRNRVEHAVNRLDGVVCRVNLRKKTARISYSVPVSDETLRETIEALGYEVQSSGRKGTV